MTKTLTMQTLKKALAASSIGQKALSFREHRELKHLASSASEQTGQKVNDLTSRRLRDALCDDGKIFVDVGAHIGSVIGGVMHASRPGKIIAIEAMPDKIEDLRRNFPDAQIIHCAVGESEGEVEFTVDAAASGYSSLDPAVRDRTADFYVLKVWMRRLDDVLPHEGIDVMKIDIEGAELGALRGADKVIAGSRPVIVFESGVHDMQGFPRAELFQWFAGHDYDVVAPIRVAHNAPAMTLDVFMDAHEYPRLTQDFFGIPKERRIEIRDRARSILGITV